MKVIQTILYLTVVIHLVLIKSGSSICSSADDRKLFDDDSCLLNCSDKTVEKNIGQFNEIFNNAQKHLTKSEMVR